MCRVLKHAASVRMPHPGGPTGTNLAMKVGSLLAKGWGAFSMSGAPAAAGVAAEVMLVGGIAAPVFSGFAALYGIGQVSAQANALGRYNAFLEAFAWSVSDFARGVDRRRTNVEFRDASIQGRNAAIRVLTEVGADTRRAILQACARMHDPRAVAAIVASMGGYRTR